MAAYPEKSILKKLYPEVGYKILREENEVFYGYETLNGKILPYVLWKGSSPEELEYLILKVWHWEKTGKKLEPPLPISKKEVFNRQVHKDTSEEKISRRGESMISSIWMHNNVTAERVRIKSDQKEEYVQKGFIEGKKFTEYVDPKRIERVAQEKKTAYLAALKDAYHARKNVK